MFTNSWWGFKNIFGTRPAKEVIFTILYNFNKFPLWNKLAPKLVKTAKMRVKHRRPNEFWESSLIWNVI